jgi:hypothetical protein
VIVAHRFFVFFFASAAAAPSSSSALSPFCRRGENPLDPKAGVAKAASVIQAKGSGLAKALQKEWGLQPEHGHLSTEQKRQVLYAQLDELEAALGIEQKSKAGLALLLEQYKDNPEQMQVVDGQLRDINRNLGGLEAQLDKVQQHINSLQQSSWQASKRARAAAPCVYYRLAFAILFLTLVHTHQFSLFFFPFFPPAGGR